MRLIDDNDLNAAVAANILERGQVDRLLAFLSTREGPARPTRFDSSHILWYAGALIIIGAMGLFTTLAFDAMGGKALTITALIYAAIAGTLAHLLWNRPGLRAPAGLLIAVAVSMTPLAIFGVQASFDLWPTGFEEPAAYGAFYDWINASWVYMEIGTIVVGLVAIRFYPFPCIAAIIAIALWFLSMDLAAWFFGGDNWSWQIREDVSMWFGLALMVAACALDLRKWPAGDFAFWLHLCGVVAFWGGLTAHDSDSEVAKAIYCLINIALILLAVFLMRRVYAVFGAIGVACYLGYLADEVFADSLLFPIALSAVGLGIIGAGIFYFRRRSQIMAWLAANLPPTLQRLRPAHARHLG
ncbi:MAG: hypothetical protein IPK59_05025 [Rhodospirillaceae bacterium]|nr:hypothetical protein [Rhodospirillaceae bacterium]